MAFALGHALPGDLVVVFADDVTATWKQVIYWGGKERRGSDLPAAAEGGTKGEGYRLFAAEAAKEADPA